MVLHQTFQKVDMLSVSTRQSFVVCVCESAVEQKDEEEDIFLKG